MISCMCPGLLWSAYVHVSAFYRECMYALWLSLGRVYSQHLHIFFSRMYTFYPSLRSVRTRMLSKERVYTLGKLGKFGQHAQNTKCNIKTKRKPKKNGNQKANPILNHNDRINF
jgi:hypothetical protein